MCSDTHVEAAKTLQRRFVAKAWQTLSVRLCPSCVFRHPRSNGLRSPHSPFTAHHFFYVRSASDKATGRGNCATLMTCDKVTWRWPTTKLSLCFSPFFLPNTPSTLFSLQGRSTAVLRRRKTLRWCFSMSPWSACHPAAAALAGSHPPWFL